MQPRDTGKNIWSSSHEDRSRAAAAFWDLLWLMEALELTASDEVMQGYDEGSFNVPEYICKFGKPDSKLRKR